MITKKVLEDLYLVKKKSVSEIAHILKRSENGVNYWILKHSIKKRGISEAVYNQKNPKGDPFKKPKNISLNADVLYGLGMGLFWGEGTKKNKHSVRLGNTDPYLIKAFILFLERIFRIERSKLRFGIQIFEDLDKETVRRHWIRTLNIKSSQIYPSVVVSKSLKSGTYKIKNKCGVVIVYFNNTNLKKLLDEHIENIKKID